MRPVAKKGSSKRRTGNGERKMDYMWNMSGPERLQYMRQLAQLAEAQLLARDRARRAAERRRRTRALEAAIARLPKVAVNQP